MLMVIAMGRRDEQALHMNKVGNLLHKSKMPITIFEEESKKRHQIQTAEEAISIPVAFKALHVSFKVPKEAFI